MGTKDTRGTADATVTKATPTNTKAAGTSQAGQAIDNIDYVTGIGNSSREQYS